MFYERFLFLCRLLGLEPTRAALLAGFSNGTPSYWKKQKDGDIRISNNTILRLANFFMVDPEYLAGNTSEYRSDLAHSVLTQHYPNYLVEIIKDNMKRLLKSGAFSDVERENVKSIMSYKELPTLEELEMICGEAGVDVSYLFGPYSYCIKGKVDPNQEVRVALFGGDVEVTDAMWDEVKAYAALILARQKTNKEGS